MEIEVLVVGIVIRVRHLNERDALLQEAAREQAVASEVIFAIALGVLRWLFADIEHFTLSHQLVGLFEGIRKCFRAGGSPGD